MKNLLLPAFVIIIFSLRIGAEDVAYQSVNDSGAVSSFAEALFSKGDYFRAITEYKRAIFLSPENRDYFTYKIGLSCQRAHRWDEALTEYSKISDTGIFAEKRLLRTAECYVALKKKDGLSGTREQIRKTAGAGGIQYAGLLTGIYEIFELNFAEAEKVLGEPVTGGDAKTDELKSMLMAECRTALELPSKSPAIAGALSLIPGLGQIYAGRMGDGLFAMAVETILAGTAVYAFVTGNYPVSYLAGFGGVVFYAGNIYSAVNLANRQNAEQNADFVKNLIQKYRLKEIIEGRWDERERGEDTGD